MKSIILFSQFSSSTMKSVFPSSQFSFLPSTLCQYCCIVLPVIHTPTQKVCPHRTHSSTAPFLTADKTNSISVEDVKAVERQLGIKDVCGLFFLIVCLSLLPPIYNSQRIGFPLHVRIWLALC
jgi:hypothetical protein